jgi:hypothetical protein
MAGEGKVFTDRRQSEHPEAGNPNQRCHFHPLCGETHDRRLPCVHPCRGEDVCHCGARFSAHPVQGGWACGDFRRAVRGAA